MSQILSALIIALFLTIIIEFLVFLAIFRGGWKNLLLYSALINSLTNPLLNYWYLFLFPHLLLLELLVVAVETILILALIRTSLQYAVLCSICANGASVLAGLLLWKFHLL